MKSTDLIELPIIMYNIKEKHKILVYSINNMYLTAVALSNNMGKSYGEISDYFVEDFCIFIGNLTEKDLILINKYKKNQ